MERDGFFLTNGGKSITLYSILWGRVYFARWKGGAGVRQSGILMHITSLPGRYGIGTLGKAAFRFVDFLEAAGQSCWQLLPLNPTGYGDSPYQSCSAFAGNHYLIDLELLVEAGLLLPEEPASLFWGDGEERVDFGLQYQNKLKLLRKAYSRFEDRDALWAFTRRHSSWLPDFALYMALKDARGGAPWYQWEEPLKRRDPDALWQIRKALSEEIGFYTFVQYLFYSQWEALRQYACDRGIRIIGDVPIYVPLDSVEVWCSPELFQLEGDLTPTAVAGCPPDAFSEDGQLWGNPLYRWDVMAKDGYRWWICRLEAAGEWFDVIRLDHFRGFASYWSVPFGDPTARGGQWLPGPGMEFFRAVKKALPKLSLIAEDLGVLTPDVLQLLADSGLPGMKVLGFAFDSREPSLYLPHTYEKNTVCYTGTHDNMTTRQWLDTAPADAVAYAEEYMCLGKDPVRGVVRTAMASVSDLCLIPMQDWLGLGGEARMNFPGTTGNNWVWRVLPEAMTDKLAQEILEMTVLYGRFVNKEK